MLGRTLTSLLVVLTSALFGRADDLFVPLDRPLVLPPNALLAGPTDPVTANRTNRIRLFRMQPGFLYGPPGLDPDDPALAEFNTTDTTSDWMQFALGNDNPFFDIRRPGDPGGVGYYKMHSQVQLFDSPKTSFTVNLQAVTPAGRDQDGVADGQTILTPTFGLFHELEDGTAFQGFLGKEVPFVPRGGAFHRGMQCGMAVQKPLWLGGVDRADNFYLFLGTLGRVRRDDVAGPTPALDLMPGLHWQVSPVTWMTGSFILPVNTIGRPDGAGWQLTLSWQF